MTPVLFVLAAGGGAMLRHAIARFACAWQALFVVNVVGAGLLGYVVERDLPGGTTTILATGFCGAFTTFSSFALELRSLGWRLGAGYAASTVLCACGAAAVGSALAGGW